MTSDNILELRSVSRHFGGVPAVAGVDLSARAGAITGLIGPNGAGKTTVVNLVSGFLHLTSGQVLLEGRNVSRSEAAVLARAGIARTYQNIRLIPDATVIENVLAGFHRHEVTGFWANALGLPRARAEAAKYLLEADTLLKRFQMTEFAGHRAGNLSYGHQRRIEIMRALATSPKLLLLDEPVAGMNDAEAGSLGEIFREIAADGVAILLIEHNIRLVSSICSYLYVLSSGRSICEGVPDEVFRDQRVIEAYLGA